MYSKPRRVALIFLFGLFIVFRTASLTRDLAFEESLFLIPGRSLFQGFGFGGYIGELLPHFSPFHKPPLASLIPGMFSFLSLDWVHAGRLFSLLVSLWVCFMGVIFFDSLLVCFLAILSPFLLVAAAHMQTDPTVGLLGISLVSVSFFIDSSNRKRLLLLALGFVVLWCGKFELAVCAAFALFCAGILIPQFRTKRYFLEWAAVNLLGILCVFILSGILGLTRGDPFTSPFMEILGTLTGITSSVSSGLAKEGLHIDRGSIYSDLRHQKFFHLVALCILPFLFAFRQKLFSKSDLARNCTALLISLTVFGVYFLGGWKGDGFPRYFLGSIPPLLCVLAATDDKLKSTFTKPYWSWGMIALILVLFLPRSFQNLKTPSGITGRGLWTGYREAAEIAEAFTHENDLIVAPEPSLPYLEKRKWLADFTFQPYPETYPKVLTYKNQIKAAITDTHPLTPSTPYEHFMAELLKPLIDQGAISVSVGTFQVFVLPPSAGKKEGPHVQ